MMWYQLIGTELETESLNKSSEVAEKAKDFVENPGIIMNWLKGVLPNFFSFLIQLLIALVLFWIGKKIIKWIVKVASSAMERAKVDKSVANFLGQLIRYGLYFVLVFVLLGIFGVGTGSAVAILGSLGVTVGLALQGSLSNFAGGVLILILKPFGIGDYIVDGSGKEGTVSSISIFYTTLTTVDNKVILIPNGSLMNSTITNVSKMDKRRVDLIVGVAYEADVAEVKAALQEVVAGEDRILRDLPVQIFVDELADCSVNYGIRVWVPASDYWAVKWQLTENIKLKLDEKNISIPYPQLDVQIKK